MGQQVIERTATTGADPAAVYALLADGSTWPEWSPLGSFTLVEPGDGDARGPGGGPTVHDRAGHRAASGWSSARPDEVFSYVLEAGLPLRDYRAVVTLTPTASGHVHQLALDLPGQGARQRAGSTAASWARSSAGPSTGWPRRRTGRAGAEPDAP